MSKTVPSERLHRRGRDDELADLVAARQGALLRTAYLLTGDEASARDLVTDSLAKLHLSWGEVRRDEGADVFLRRVMFRSATSWRRRWSVAHSAPRNVEGRGLWAGIRALPATQRALVVLCDYEGLSEREAADVLGISERRARSLTGRARSAVHAAATPGVPEGRG